MFGTTTSIPKVEVQGTLVEVVCIPTMLRPIGLIFITLLMGLVLLGVMNVQVTSTLNEWNKFLLHILDALD